MFNQALPRLPNRGPPVEETAQVHRAFDAGEELDAVLNAAAVAIASLLFAFV